MVNDEIPSIIELIEDQARRWEAGERPPLRWYLGEYPRLSEEPDCVCALVLKEIELRIKAGESVGPVDYHEVLDADTFEKLEKNYRAGQSLKATVDLDLKVFPGYETVRWIGSGGFGAVYLVRNQVDGAEVALKTLPWLIRVTPAAARDLRREFYIYKFIKNYNIIKCFEYIDIYENRDPFFTMEYVRRAVTVVEAFRSYRSLRRWLTWSLQLATALQALHRAGFVHRDLKPSNVLVSLVNLQLKIIDVGLAARLPLGEGDDPSCFPGAGAVEWMPPEQRAEYVDQGGVANPHPSNDWYPFGLLLAAGLTHRDPNLFLQAQLRDDRQVADRLACRSLLSKVSDRKGQSLPQPFIDLIVRLLDDRCEARPDGDEVLATLHTLLGIPYFPPTSPQFLDRKMQLGRLTRARGRVRPGKVVVRVIEGEAACGKSSLTQRFVNEQIVANDDVVLNGRCLPSVAMPFEGLSGPIHDLLKKILGLVERDRRIVLADIDCVSIDRLKMGTDGFGRLGQPESRETQRYDSDEDRRAKGIQSLRALLKNYGTFLHEHKRRLVIWIDDLQWIDRDSAAVMVDLLQPPDPPPLLFLGCYKEESRDRPGETNLRILRAALDKAVSSDKDSIDFDTVVVGPLPAGYAHDLAADLIRRPRNPDPATLDSRLLAQITEQSQRKPLFIEQLAEYALRIDPKSDADLAKLTLTRAQRSNFRALPKPSRRLLTFLALSDVPFLYAPDAYEGAKLNPTMGRKAQADLVAYRWIAEDASSRHRSPTDRDRHATEDRELPHLLTVYHDTQRSLIKSWHSSKVEGHADRLLKVILASKYYYRSKYRAEVWERASLLRKDHLERDRGLVEAARLYEEAGRDANGDDSDHEAGVAFEEAIIDFSKSLEYGAKTDADRHRVIKSLARALANAGRTDEAASHYLNAIEIGNRIGLASREKEVVSTRLLAAECFLVSGRITTGRKIYHGILREFGMQLPRRLAVALVWLAISRWILRRRDTRFCPRGKCVKDQLSSDIIGVCWSSTAMSVIDTIRSACFQLQALQLALKIRDPYLAARAMAAEASYLSAFGEDDNADRFLRDARDWAAHIPEDQTRKQIHAFGIIKLSEGIIAYSRGNWKDAMIICEEAIRVLERCSAIGVAWERKTAKTFVLWSLFQQGTIAELGKDEVIKTLLDPGYSPRERFKLSVSDQVNLINAVVMVHLARGISGPSMARDYLNRSETEWSENCPVGDFYIQHHSILDARIRIALYEGTARDAWEMIQKKASFYRKSFILMIKQIKIEYVITRANVALAIADGTMDSKERTRFLRIADRHRSELTRIRAQQSDAFARLVGAQQSRINREPGAVAMLEEAAKSLTAAGLTIHAAAAHPKISQWDPANPRSQEYISMALSFSKINNISYFNKYSQVFVPAN